MVKRATALGRNGVSDWIIQRVSAVVLLAYFVFLMVFLIQHDPLTFPQWQSLFAHRAMRVFTLLAAVATVLHAWIGLWGVLTDYVKCQRLRLALMVLVRLALAVQLLWLLDWMWR